MPWDSLLKNQYSCNKIHKQAYLVSSFGNYKSLRRSSLSSCHWTHSCISDFIIKSPCCYHNKITHILTGRPRLFFFEIGSSRYNCPVGLTSFKDRSDIQIMVRIFKIPHMLSLHFIKDNWKRIKLSGGLTPILSTHDISGTYIHTDHRTSPL